MAIPAEHLYVACTCTGGMRDGGRCADCGGRGIVRKGAPILGTSEPPPAPDEAGDALEQLGINDLRKLAKELGVGAGGSRGDIAGRIREARGVTEEDGGE